MILLVILAGLYLIGVIGYYKLTLRQMSESEEALEGLRAKPIRAFFILSSIAVFWPVLVYWALVGEASR